MIDKDRNVLCERSGGMKDCECGEKAEDLCIFKCGTNGEEYEIRCPLCGESSFAKTFEEAEKQWDAKFE